MPFRASPNATAPEARCHRPVRVTSKAGAGAMMVARDTPPGLVLTRRPWWHIPPSPQRNQRAGLLIAIVVLFAGLLPVLVDRRRRGLYDMLAGTVVESTEPG